MQHETILLRSTNPTPTPTHDLRPNKTQQRYRQTSLGWLLALLVLLGAPTTTMADTSSESVGTNPRANAVSATPLPSVEQLDKKLQELEAAKGMDEATKLSLSELYRRTQANLEDAAGFEAKAKEFTDALVSAPKQTEDIQRQLELRQTKSADKQTADVPGKLSTEDIDQRLNKVLAEMAAHETRVSELDKLLDESLERPTSNRDRLIAVKQSLDALDNDLNKPSALSDSPELAQARRWALQTQRLALWSEARMLEQNLLSQSVRERLFKAQRDLTVFDLKTLEARRRVLEEALGERRKQQTEAAQEASEKAQRDAEDKHPLVRQLLLQNVDITDSLARITKRLEGFSQELAQMDSERKRIEDDFRGAKQRLDAAGLSKALGQVLLDTRNQLPDLSQYRKHIEAREDEIADATLNQIRYREEERLLRDIGHYADELIAKDATAEMPQVREQLIEALEQRKKLLSQVLRIEDDHIRQLGELNYAAERVVRVSKSYDDFLAERLLWVRSAPTIGLDTLTALPGAIGWMLSPKGWTNVLEALLERIQHSAKFWFGLAVVAILFWKLSTIRRAIRANAEPLRRVRTDHIRFTLNAIGASLLIALPLPLTFWLLGQQLQNSPVANTFANAFGAAFGAVAIGLFCLLAFRMLCISGGVADRHFRWSTQALKQIRRNFDWFALYMVPVSMVTVATYYHNDSDYVSSLGRLTLIATMLGLAAFLYLLLQPDRGVLQQFFQARPTAWITRLRHVWFPIIVAAPLTLVVLSIIGYVYTAGTLFQSLVYQLWLVLALVVVHQTIVRWLIVTRRRLALQAALDRQAARRAQAEAETSDSGSSSEVILVEETEPDLAALDEQTRRLITAFVFIGGAVGLWLTWSDVLPAFNMLERLVLWHYTGMVNGAEQLIPVSAADVGLVFVILFIATIMAKNLPALLEIVLLQSESVSAGARYAIKTLSSYLITAVAVLLTFSTLGLNWGKLQWLVAALGVGIGFGLQEIVANFISGIIILFERPVRVGDIVTIGDTTGVVTNIRIRATTIRNWDKQELVVPNKEFITGRLLNWTLTDQQNRITIAVGIEYGSDTRKALALLAHVAEQHERVLDDPAPLISFEGFGDNSLTVVLRCYLDSLDGRIGVITEIHQAIYDTYSENGIQIAFPQRDVRLFTQQPLDIRLSPDGMGESPGSANS